MITNQLRRILCITTRLTKRRPFTSHHVSQKLHSIYQEFNPHFIMQTNCSGTKPEKWRCRNHQNHDRLPLARTTLSVQSLWVRFAASHLLFPSRPAPPLQRTMNDLITCRLQYLYHQTKVASHIQVSYSSGNLWTEQTSGICECVIKNPIGRGECRTGHFFLLHVDRGPRIYIQGKMSY